MEKHKKDIQNFDDSIDDIIEQNINWDKINVNNRRKNKIKDKKKYEDSQYDDDWY